MEEPVEFEEQSTAEEMPVLRQAIEPPGDIHELEPVRQERVLYRPEMNELQRAESADLCPVSVPYDQSQTARLDVEQTDELCSTSARVEQAQPLNAPYVNVQKITVEHIIDERDDQETGTRIERVQVSVLDDECNLKVGITTLESTKLLSMAHIENLTDEQESCHPESRELSPYYPLTETRTLTTTTTTKCPDYELTSSDSVFTLEVKNCLALPQQIIELTEVNKCHELTVTSPESTHANIECVPDTLTSILNITNRPMHVNQSSTVSLEQCEPVQEDEHTTDPHSVDNVHVQQPELLSSIDSIKPLVLSLPQVTLIDHSFGNVQTCPSSRRPTDEFVQVNKQADELTNLDAVEHPTALNMPNFKPVECIDERTDILRTSPTNLMSPRVSRECNRANEMAEMASLVSLLNAARTESEPSREEHAPEFWEQFPVQRVELRKEQSSLTSSSIEHAEPLHLLNAPRSEQTDDGRIEYTADIYDPIYIDQALVKKEIPETPVVSPIVSRVDLLNAPKHERALDANSEYTHDIRDCDVEEQTAFVDRVKEPAVVKPLVNAISLLNAPRYEDASDEDSVLHELTGDDSVHVEQVQPVNEQIILNNKPDKKLLLWLSYPRMSSNLVDYEEAIDIDEKLDYLYEKIGLDRLGQDDLHNDNNLIRIEKILSLFISNQENVQFQEEILKYLPYSRPELQQLILSRQSLIELDESCILNSTPMQLSACVKKNVSFDEDSIDELRLDDADAADNVQIKQEPVVLNNLACIENVSDLSKELPIDEDDEPHLTAKSTLDEGLTLERADVQPMQRQFVDVLHLSETTTTTMVNHHTETITATQLIEQTPLNRSQVALVIHRADDVLSPIPIEISHEISIDPEPPTAQSADSLWVEITQHNVVSQVDHMFNDVPTSWEMINPEQYKRIEPVAEADYRFDRLEPRSSTSLDVEPRLQSMINCCYDDDADRFFLDTTNSTTRSLLDHKNHRRPTIDDDDESGSTSSSSLDRFDLDKLQDELDKVRSSRDYFTPIEIKVNRTNNDDEHSDQEETSAASSHSTTSTTSSTSSSDNSGKMHLIESVEIVTHHRMASNNPDSCASSSSGDESVIHIHKVDINRLKIKEKSADENSVSQTCSAAADSRFKVNYKQEEILDLRDKLTDEERLQLNTNKVFAKAFVEQIINLSSKKLANVIEPPSYNLTPTTTGQHDLFESIDLNNISTKTTSEIIESLNTLKEDIGKHLTKCSEFEENERHIDLDLTVDSIDSTKVTPLFKSTFY